MGNVPDWVLAGRVRQIWFGQGLALVVQAATHADSQELTGVSDPVRDGADWVFEVEPTRARTIAGGEGTFWLGLFDLTTLRYDELACARGEDGKVRAVGAAAQAARLTPGESDPEWILEQRVGGVTVARSRRE